MTVVLLGQVRASTVLMESPLKCPTNDDGLSLSKKRRVRCSVRWEGRRREALRHFGVFEGERGVLVPMAVFLGFAWAEASGAGVALAFDVEVLGQRGQMRSAIAQLLEIAQHDFGAGVVLLDLSLNRDCPALQLANIANGLEICSKDDHGEWAGVVIGAEIEEGDAVMALFDAHYGTTHAVLLADLFCGFGDGQALRGIEVG